MADFTTSDTYNNLLKAANAAFSKIGIWNSSTTEGNKKMTSSLADIQAAMSRIDKLKMNTTNLDRVAQLDALKAKYQQRANDIQAYSDKANNVKPPAEDNFPIADMLGGAASLVKIGMAAELANKSFEDFADPATAKSLVSNLREMAATSPFNSAALMKDAQSLLASGTAAESVLPTLKALGEVSGGDEEKLGALSTAFATLQQDGHLTTESLKAMKAAGFDPLKGLPDGIAVEGEGLAQSLKDGCISADMVATALSRAAASGSVMGGESKTASEAMHRMNERLDAAAATVGASLMPIVTSFVDGALIPLAQGLQTVAAYISENISWIGGIVTAIGAGLVVYQLWTTAQAILNAVMSANPLMLIIVGVTALIAGVIYLANSFSGFRAVLMAVWEVAKTVGTIFYEIYIGPIRNMATGIMAVFEALKALVSGDWKSAGASGMKALKDFTNFTSLENMADEAMTLGQRTRDAYNNGLKEKISLKSDFSAPAIPGTDKLMSGGVMKIGPNWKPADKPLEGAKATAEGITSGGARSVNVSVQKLFDNINITTNTIAEGISDMEQQVTEALLRILNNANATA